MLYIDLKGGACKNWHVGTGAPRDIVHPDNVTSIMADGDELSHIGHKFGVSAPIPAGCSVVRWYGETAKFIVGNLD
jgi:hypothetical protein